MATPKMSFWSAENATKAYIRTMNMAKGEDVKELNGAEFVSALAAGNNARFTVVACAGPVDSITLALAAASQQTGGRVICILPENYSRSNLSLVSSSNGMHVEFVVGDAQELILNKYREADFIAVDCNLDHHEEIFRSVEGSGRVMNTVVLGYNAFGKPSWRSGTGLRINLLPIGEGLLMTRIPVKKIVSNGVQKRGNWIVKVDKCTGEEHFFRVRSSPRSVIEA
ncbi:unnamed protein product [Cuscuta epithymum]|uniref:S-adenosyl-L-methionine-dependent methyltransferase n=1 Tax=Cuscuta epithymum TaxID=186058 RepID=A0AAV0D2S4_9ASTE|nr:unnamed protein product [Cuscuta epithymum]